MSNSDCEESSTASENNSGSEHDTQKRQSADSNGSGSTSAQPKFLKKKMESPTTSTKNKLYDSVGNFATQVRKIIGDPENKVQKLKELKKSIEINMDVLQSLNAEIDKEIKTNEGNLQLGPLNAVEIDLMNFVRERPSYMAAICDSVKNCYQNVRG